MLVNINIQKFQYNNKIRYFLIKRPFTNIVQKKILKFLFFRTFFRKEKYLEIKFIYGFNSIPDYQSFKILLK